MGYPHTDNTLNTKEFMQGQKDCKAGIPHKEGSGKSYTRGYAAQYELEQRIEHATKNRA